MRLLPKEQQTLARSGDAVVVGSHEHEGYRNYERFALSDLPNNLVSLDDLKRVGVDVVDGRAVA